MRFSVSSSAGHNKVSVGVPTEEEALSWARELQNGSSARVTITITATGVRFSEEQFKAALRNGDTQADNAHAGSIPSFTRTRQG
jgi:TRAP-type C4-dicarboxylate transport system substrate-binding protein